MTSPKRPQDEETRLAALHSLGLLDTEAEERFDRITRLACRIFGTSMATVSLVDADRQWFKSSVGLPFPETAREDSFCAHAILDDEPLVIGDATTDYRFADNPQVLGEPNIRFYAGQPISAPGGEKLGTLCVIDDQPRSTDDFDAEALRELADMVEHEIATLKLAIADELTGLANRRGFAMLAPKVVNVADRFKLSVAVIYADVDQFKLVNDEFGHATGDTALREVASMLESNLRDTDVIARMGGDEFSALLSGAAAEGAEEAVSRLRAAFATRNLETGLPYDLRLSFGVAAATPGPDRELTRLLADADDRMREDKRSRGAAR